MTKTTPKPIGAPIGNQNARLPEGQRRQVVTATCAADVVEIIDSAKSLGYRSQGELIDEAVRLLAKKLGNRE